MTKLNNPLEVWKPLPDYADHYHVSNLGRIKSLERIGRFGKQMVTHKTRILKQSPKGNGYLTVALCKGGKPVTRYVHRLVSKTFLPNPESKKDVNHINGNVQDNRVENLEWATRSENHLHAYNHLGRISHHRKGIIHVDKFGNQREYPSLTSAAKELNTTTTSICDNLKGKTKSLIDGSKFYYQRAFVPRQS